MRNRFFSLALGITMICGGAAMAQPSTIVGGHFRDAEDRELMINAFLYPLDLIEGNSLVLQPEIDKNNEFSTGIGFDRPFYVRYVDKGKLLKGTYVMPGDKIWLDVAYGETKLSGSNKKLLTFLSKLETVFENAEVEIRDTTVYKTMKRTELMNYLKDRRDQQLRYVLEYFVGLPPLQMEMRRLLEAEINYSFALKMLRYSRSEGREKRFVFRYRDYMSAIEEVISSDPSALISTAYAQFVYELPYTLWYSEINWNMTDKPPYEQRIRDEFITRDSIARKYFKGEVYELALYAILLDGIKDAAKAKGSPEFDAAYNKAEKLIRELGKSFDNKLYYGRALARLEELKVPEKKEAPKSKSRRRR